MIHLLYLYGGDSGLSFSQLWNAGVDCKADGTDPVINAGVAASKNDNLELTQAATKILEVCTLGYKNGRTGDFRVDYPSVFVAMPYREPWESLYSRVFEPAVLEAGMECRRADRTVRIGDLNDKVWAELAAAGVILADVSVRNPNVFYELGIANAMGKDIILVKNHTKRVPADFKGTLYYEYDPQKLKDLKAFLIDTLRKWASARCSKEVASLYGQR
jgi:hypothetical protein